MMPRKSRLLLAGLVPILLVGAGCSPPVRTPSWLRTVDNPAGPGSGQPNLAVGADGVVYLSWLEPAADSSVALRFSRWTGEGWSAARTVAAGSDWLVNWADFPSLAALADGTLAAHWLVKNAAGPYAYDVFVSVSSDGGKSWTDPVRAHGDRTDTEHGFASLVPLDADHFLVVWLDGRELVAAGHDSASPAEAPGEGHGAMGQEGAMTLRSAVLDRSGRVGPDRLVDDRVCDCCGTSGALLGDGRAVVAYRDRSPGEIRDIALAAFADGQWSEPRLLHADGWEIPGCPVNGPALAVRGDVILGVWFTAPGEKAAVRAAFAGPDLVFGPPVTLDLGRPLGRVDAAFLPDGRGVVSWMEAMGEEAVIVVQALSRAGDLGEPEMVVRSNPARSSGFPRLAPAGGRLLLAWTEVGDPGRIRTATLEDPGAR